MTVRKKMAEALLWGLGGKIAIRMINFVFTVFLARLLTPADFGVMAVAGMLIGLPQFLIDFGLSQALIIVKQPTEVQISSVFWLNLIMSVALCLSLLFLSGPLAAFFAMEAHVSLFRLLTPLFVIMGLSNIQGTLLSKHLEQKKANLIEVTSKGFAGLVGVLSAFAGAGVWALAIHALLGPILKTWFFWRFSPWRPAWVFQWRALRPLWDLSKPLLGAGVVNQILDKVDTVMLGRFMPPAVLGLFSRGVNVAQLSMSMFLLPLTRSLFPVLSHEAAGSALHRDSTLTRFQVLFLFVLLPVQALFFFLAEPFLRLIYGAPWVPAAPWLRIVSLGVVVLVIHGVSSTFLKARGQTGLIFRMTLWNRLGYALAFVPLFWWPLQVLTVTLPVFYVSFFLFLLHVQKRHLGQSLMDQLVPLAVMALVAFVWLTLLHAIPLQGLVLPLVVPTLLFLPLYAVSVLALFRLFPQGGALHWLYQRLLSLHRVRRLEDLLRWEALPKA
jgi:O-antigen/teichoic acid export membrane protein